MTTAATGCTTSPVLAGNSNDDTLVKPSDDKDLMFTASVAELRRKAQEHSAALWHSLQQIQSSVSGPTEPMFPKFDFSHFNHHPATTEIAKECEKEPQNEESI
jgi:hypothetical protein